MWGKWNKSRQTTHSQAESRSGFYLGLLILLILVVVPAKVLPVTSLYAIKSKEREWNIVSSNFYLGVHKHHQFQDTAGVLSLEAWY